MDKAVSCMAAKGPIPPACEIFSCPPRKFTTGSFLHNIAVFHLSQIVNWVVIYFPRHSRSGETTWDWLSAGSKHPFV